MVLAQRKAYRAVTREPTRKLLRIQWNDFRQGYQNLQWEKTVFSTNNARKTRYHTQKNEVELLPLQHM